jgi:lipopolysaccharide/colanic/teichoic acid biosynthesis glycosyltransferase
VESVKSVVKRLFDLLASGLGLLLLFPLFLLLALLVKLSSPGPVFYHGLRVGRRGRPFKMLKFRTMVADAEARGLPLTVGGDSRITGVGRFLRNAKLDELPQLWNVLKGEMSLVGPRPEAQKYVDLYTDDQRKVLEIRPGITDPASIKYRNENEILAAAVDPEKAYIANIMPDKVRLNLSYASRASVLSDLGIIFRTLFRIVKP